jgi:hypothetical protein
MSWMAIPSGVSKTHAHCSYGSKILTRQEAKSRLQLLAPGSEEHTQLQNALIKMAGIVEIHGPTTAYKVSTLDENQRLLGGFGSSEHVAIGKAVSLKGLEDNQSIKAPRLAALEFSQSGSQQGGNV